MALLPDNAPCHRDRRETGRELRLEQINETNRKRLGKFYQGFHVRDAP